MIDGHTTFNPDWVSPPGDTISDLLEERGWSQDELAKKLGYTTKHFRMIINGNAPITEDTAMRLERVLGGSVAFWLSREAYFFAKKGNKKEQNGERYAHKRK